MKKFVVGIVISAVFLYFSIRGIDQARVVAVLQDAQYAFLIPPAVLFPFILYLRSLRWATILSPLESINQRKLFPVTCLGFMGVALLPLRVGEVVRPYLITTRSKIPLSSALATIFVERMFDLMTLLSILVVVISYVALPGWVVKSIVSTIGSFAVVVLLLIFATKGGVSLKFIGKTSWKFRIIFEKIMKDFSQGLKVIHSPKSVIYATLFSILIWVLSGLAIYSLFYFQNLQLPIAGAFVVLVISILGISLPSAPGFLGTFQMSCILALSLFNIPKTDALAFSLVYYFLGIGVNIAAGLLFLPFERITLKDMKKALVLNRLQNT